jgi:hypothetical protein
MLSMAALVLAVVPLGECRAEIESVTETFSNGFDNEGWHGSWSVGDVIFEESGLYLHGDDPSNSGSFAVELTRVVTGKGPFRSRMEFRNVDLSNPGVDGGASRIAFRHRLDERTLGIANAVEIRLTSDRESGELGIRQDDELLLVSTSRDVDLIDSRMFVSKGVDIALEIEFETSEVGYVSKYYYDHDIDDDVPAVLYSTLPYTGSVDEVSHRFEMNIAAVGLQSSFDGLIDSWQLRPISNVVGDFDGDELLTADDFDLLGKASRHETNDVRFDLDRDGKIDSRDHDAWVHDLKDTYYGDSNLDGEFSSVDLINALQDGEYDDDITHNSSWATGDWSGDSEFTSSDLVLAFQDGGYEQGPRPAANAVPEPTAAPLLLVSFVLLRGRVCGARETHYWASL